MSKTVTAGVVLAVAAAAALLIGDGLGWDLDGVLFLGIGVGGALGLIPDKTPVARILGLLLGLLAAAIGYALRAAVFPDNTTARAVAVALVVLIAMGFVLLTFGRIPFWTALLGVGALGGAYEVAYTESPSSLLDTMPVALTSLLAMIAVGFAATVFFSSSDDESTPKRKRQSAEQPPDEPPEETASLDDVLSGGGN